MSRRLTTADSSLTNPRPLLTFDRLFGSQSDDSAAAGRVRQTLDAVLPSRVARAWKVLGNLENVEGFVEVPHESGGVKRAVMKVSRHHFIVPFYPSPQCQTSDAPLALPSPSPTKSNTSPRHFTCPHSQKRSFCHTSQWPPKTRRSFAPLKPVTPGYARPRLPPTPSFPILNPPPNTPRTAPKVRATKHPMATR